MGHRFRKSVVGVVMIAVATFASASLAGACSSPKSSSPLEPPDASLPGVSSATATIGAAGGTIATPDGASLVIPAGALTADTVIRISIPEGQAATAQGTMRWVFEPDGLKFAVPARFTFPYKTPADGANITVVQSSSAAPLVDVGGEQSNFTYPNVLANDTTANTVAVELEHFTFVAAFIAVVSNVNLVLDVPPAFLKPADLLFTLTGAPNANWQPGHVGLFAYPTQRDACDPPKTGDLIYEAQTPGGVQMSTLYAGSSGFGFKVDPGHLYLGARRGGALSDAQRLSAVAWTKQQLGAFYSPVGAGVVDNFAFSCVGLVEAAYASVGNKIAPTLAKVFVSVPVEDYYYSSPIGDIDIRVGESLDIPVSAVIVDPHSPSLGLTFRGWYTDRGSACSGPICSSYTITRDDTNDAPTATFNAGASGHFTYHFAPTDADAGKSYSVRFMVAGKPHATGPLGGDSDLGTAHDAATVNIHVLSSCKDAGTDGMSFPLDAPFDGPCDLVGHSCGGPTCCVQQLYRTPIPCTAGTCCQPPSWGTTNCTSGVDCCAPAICSSSRCCTDYQGSCGSNDQCCSPASRQCQSGKCCGLAESVQCNADADCCPGLGLKCLSPGTANAACCVPSQGACTTDKDCCITFTNIGCTNGRCCRASGSQCGQGSDCCSGVCPGGGFCQ